jgi:hypothetical protein
MPSPERPSAPRESADRQLALLVAGCALVAGAVVAVVYWRQELTLSHYDAKAHLVVARRVLDSLTPGWKQIGAVWLPLPHLLNLLPVQVDALYRTGLSGIAFSVASFAAATACVAMLVARATGSRVGALAAAVVLASDPNVLYLQSTPMTEPLLFALLAASAVAVSWWIPAPSREASPSRPDLPRAGQGWPLRETGAIASSGRAAWVPGAVIFLACWTRYEAWPVAAALLGLAVCVLVREGVRWTVAARDVARVAAWPLAAVLLFVVNSRVSTGYWFVTGGFFVAENEAHGRPLMALAQVWHGLVEIAGMPTVLTGAAGMLLAAWWFFRDPRRAHALIGVAVLAAAALPFYAFVEGHPFRVRYMVVLVLGVAVGCGFAVAALTRRSLQLAALLALAVSGPSPLDAAAPMVVEAQWDRPASRARQAVTACLVRDFVRPRDKILASMGSLAHYMQELSLEGFRLDDFVHEGTDAIWPDALDSPMRHVQWILFEEQSEGGDVLTRWRRRFPELVDGFERVCEGGGVALYRKPPRGDVELR